MMTNPNTYKTPHQTAKEQAEAKNADVLRVLAQRYELLAALNMLKAADFGANVKTADDERNMDSVAAFARAAIAKVEGGA